ncbi:GAF domain-containing protein [Jiangella mangrovi]|uniref:ANTAR domain-containing protein n=1 Tax=Jiangella mangrovi TaxID=1524084 RepID=A0A7W9GV45_9ACTN|nr:hypothetical protein [Jiangella mangrovi]
MRHVLEACAEAVEATGCGLSMVGASGTREPVLATGGPCEELEELQFTLGQGPAIDAAAGTGPVLVADLADREAVHRWPVFAPAAVRHGIRGLFALPVAAGGARVGVLDVYRDAPGDLGTKRLTTALAYADAVLILVLDERGEVAGGSARGGRDLLPERRAEVHQAAGMVSVQLGVGVGEALVRLRAYAYVHDRRLADVAADVVARRLRFVPEVYGTIDWEKGPGVTDPPPNGHQETEGEE